MSASMVVRKFGGTSVGTMGMMRQVARRVAASFHAGEQVTLVISAMGKETDQLLDLARRTSATPSAHSLDLLVTAGERRACALMAMTLTDLGVAAQSLVGHQIGLETDDAHQTARIVSLNPTPIRRLVADRVVPVIAGSQGVTLGGELTFLGRGGSDTTAVAVANGLGAICELYTDVEGLFSCDPRLLQGAQLLRQVDIDHLSEMTAAGCPKPALRAVEFARLHHVPLSVRPAMNSATGTEVATAAGKRTAVPTQSTEEVPMESPSVEMVVHTTDDALVTITGDDPSQLNSVFQSLTDELTWIDHLCYSRAEDHWRLSFVIGAEDADRLQGQVDDPGIEPVAVAVQRPVGRVTLVGHGHISNPRVPLAAFDALTEHGIPILSSSGSALRTSVVVPAEQAEAATTLLHRIARSLDLAPTG